MAIILKQNFVYEVTIILDGGSSGLSMCVGGNLCAANIRVGNSKYRYFLFMIVE
jgi:hypothetical protein